MAGIYYFERLSLFVIKIAMKTSMRLRGIANINNLRGNTCKLYITNHIIRKANIQEMMNVSLVGNLSSNLKIRYANKKLQIVHKRPFMGVVSN